MAVASAGGILSGSFPFLHRLDCTGGEAQLVETDHAALRNATFLDGRERFWRGESLVDLDELAQITAGRSARFIFHVGFCGSTLLARLLDNPGSNFILKEPQVLPDLAGQAPRLKADGKAAQFTTALEFAIDALAGSAPQGEAVIIKPTSWANAIVPDLVALKCISQALFVTMDARSFLQACFRGGRDRLTFVAGQLDLLAQCEPTFAEEAKSAMDEGGVLEQMARMVVLLHARQLSLFNDAASALASRARWTSFEKISADPIEAATNAATFFGVASEHLSKPEAAELAGRHAKEVSEEYSAEKQALQNQDIEDHHAARFDAALDWLGETLPQRVSAAAIP